MEDIKSISFVKALVFVDLLILLLFCSCTFTSSAQTIKGSTALGGYSKDLSDFFDSGHELYEKEDLRVLSAVMMLENGHAESDRCILLTGSVLMNRASKSCTWCPNTLKECVFQGYKGKGQQYASHTVENLYTVKVSDRVMALAKQLLIFGVVCPSNVLYQSMYPHQGSGNYEVIGGEYFAFG